MADMTTHKEALKLALELLAVGTFHSLELQAKRTKVIEQGLKTLAQQDQEKERCVGCEACIDTACGRDECPMGWPKAAQLEQEPVAITITGKLGNIYSFTGDYNLKKGDKVYTTPYVATPRPQRKPLTDEQIEEIAAKTLFPVSFARAIEAAHGIKGDA